MKPVWLTIKRGDKIVSQIRLKDKLLLESEVTSAIIIPFGIKDDILMLKIEVS